MMFGVGEIILFASIALVVTLPGWADDPSDVARMHKRRHR